MVSTTSEPSKNQAAAAAERGVELELHQVICFYFVYSFLALMTVITAVSYFMFSTPIPRVLLDSASFSKLNFTSSNLTANCLVSLRVINSNPNHSVCYDRFLAELSYGTGASKQPLAVARTPSFYQDGLGESIIKFQFELVNEYVAEEVRSSIISDVGARGAVDFAIQVKAQVQHDHEGKRNQLKIFCNPVTFGLLSHRGTGSMMFPLMECDVHVDYDDDDLPLPSTDRIPVNSLVSTTDEKLSCNDGIGSS